MMIKHKCRSILTLRNISKAKTYIERGGRNTCIMTKIYKNHMERNTQGSGREVKRKNNKWTKEILMKNVTP